MSTATPDNEGANNNDDRSSKSKEGAVGDLVIPGNVHNDAAANEQTAGAAQEPIRADEPTDYMSDVSDTKKGWTNRDEYSGDIDDIEEEDEIDDE